MDTTEGYQRSHYHSNLTKENDNNYETEDNDERRFTLTVTSIVFSNTLYIHAEE